MPRRPENQVEDEGNDPQAQKQSKKAMRRDIKALQERVLHVQEENRALREQIDGPAGPEQGSDNENAEQNAPRQKKLSQAQIKAWELRAKNAGARAAALYEPFLNIEPLSGHRVQTHFNKILDDVKQAREPDEELADEDNPAVYWDTAQFNTPDPVEMAREMIYHLPNSPGDIWFEVWFQAKIQEGARKQRIALTHNVQIFYAEIFGFQSPGFKDKLTRPNLPEVQARQNFLHVNEKDEDGNTNLDVFFRDMSIVRVLRLLLFGPSAIETGKRSSKARKSYARLWHITRTTPSLLAYAATVIYYVLSGDASFEEGSGTVNYTAWFHARLRLLEGVHDRHPNVYSNLMQYYNREVFGVDLQGAEDANQGGAPEDLGEDAGMDENDLTFLQEIQA